MKPLFQASFLASLISGSPSTSADEYAVIVNPGNSTEAISKNDLIQILKAETQFWEGEGRIELLLPRSKSRAKEFLLAAVYKLSEEDLKRYWVELVFRNKLPDVPRVLPSDAVAQAFVRKSRAAIAVVEVSSLAKEPGVRVLTIDGKKPGEEGYFLRDREEQLGGLGVGALPATYADDPDDEHAPAEDEILRRLRDLEERLGSQEALDEEEDLGGFELGPHLRLRGFADVRFAGKDTDTDGPGGDTATDQVVLGQLDLFITSQLSDRLSFLNETVFAPKSTGLQAANVERVIVKYEFGSSLNVQAGRFHTTLGYWNEAFHHGEWLQTAIGRPQIVAFGGDGGLLPIHLIGLAVKAKSEAGPVDLDYSLEVGNGRGATRGSEQLVSDANDQKALAFSVGVRPKALEGVRVGASAYLDDIPPNTSATAGPLHGTIEEEIYNAFATYRTSHWDVMAEIFDIRHDENGAEADSDGWYVQVGRRLHDWTPYARVEGLGVDDASTYFENMEDQERYALGLRWDFAIWSALKLQYTHTDVDAAGAGPDRDEDEVALQWAYAF
jgi:hypothetical protein